MRVWNSNPAKQKADNWNNNKWQKLIFIQGIREKMNKECLKFSGENYVIGKRL